MPWPQTIEMSGITAKQLVIVLLLKFVDAVKLQYCQQFVGVSLPWYVTTGALLQQERRRLDRLLLLPTGMAHQELVVGGC
jgi:hypothetical protein